jgi:hypothetical protein
MKTMKYNDETLPIRVPEHKVKNLVKSGYRFVPKSEWKQNVRDAKNKLPNEVLQDDEQV